MFLPDNIPIICNLPKDIEFADIFFLHDPEQSDSLFHAAENMGSVLRWLHQRSCALAIALGNIIFRHVCGDNPP